MGTKETLNIDENELPYISDGTGLPASYLFTGKNMLLFDYYNKAKATHIGYSGYYGEPSSEYIGYGGPAAPTDYGPRTPPDYGATPSPPEEEGDGAGAEEVELNSREQKLKEIYPGLEDKDYKDLVVDYSPDLIPELPIEKGSPGYGPDDPKVPSGQLAGENYSIIPRKIFERKR